MFKFSRETLPVFGVAIALFFSLAFGFPSVPFAKDFEVWLVDQSNSNGQAFGGTIYIYDGDDLNGRRLFQQLPPTLLISREQPPLHAWLVLEPILFARI